jgi:hypothetical protein
LKLEDVGTIDSSDVHVIEENLSDLLLQKQSTKQPGRFDLMMLKLQMATLMAGTKKNSKKD